MSDVSTPVPTPTSTSSKVLTYRHANKLVYVTRAETYEQAIRYAQDNFDELAGVPPEHIALHVSVLVHKQPQTVRIASNAWNEVTTTLPRYEIIDIQIRVPTPQPGHKQLADDAPPQYESSDRKSGLLEPQAAGPRAPSPNFSDRARQWIGKKVNV